MSKPTRFQPGHKSIHDVTSAGRLGKQKSPWRHGHLTTPNALRQQRAWEKQGGRKP